MWLSCDPFPLIDEYRDQLITLLTILGCTQSEVYIYIYSEWGNNFFYLSILLIRSIKICLNVRGKYWQSIIYILIDFYILIRVDNEGGPHLKKQKMGVVSGVGVASGEEIKGNAFLEAVDITTNGEWVWLVLGKEYQSAVTLLPLPLRTERPASNRLCCGYSPGQYGSSPSLHPSGVQTLLHSHCCSWYWFSDIADC